jgi:subtilisin family serine protease
VSLFVNPASAATISLNGYRFDPVREEPAIPEALRAPQTDGPASYIVQFAGPIEETWKRSVSSLGAGLLGYVPEYAFIAWMDAEIAESARSLPFVVWVGRYETAFRISPEIGTASYRDPERRDDPMLTLRARVVGELDAPLAAAATLGEIREAIQDPFAPGFVIHIDPSRVRTLAALPEILYVEELPETFLLNNTTKWVVQSNQAASTPVWDQGIFGEGQLLCMMDSGLDYNSCWFREHGNAPPGPNHRKVFDYHGHGTHVAGTAVGDQSYINSGNISYNGMAYKAKIMVQDVGSDGFFACLLGLISVPTSLTSAFTDAFNHGARAHTNSWGSLSNSYDGYCVNIDSFMWNHKDFLVLFANGNSGPGSGTVGSPATAKNCVSVGATKQSPNQEVIAGYSGRGPTSDGRFKPTVTAPGGESPTYISSANNHTGDPPSATCNVQGSPFQGTSMATPAVAGCAMLVRDYYAQGFYPQGAVGEESYLPSAALVKAMLVNGGRDMGTANQPDNNEGWGRMLLDDVLFFEGETRQSGVGQQP